MPRRSAAGARTRVGGGVDGRVDGGGVGRHRRVIAATVALLVPALAGCTASYGAQTSEPYRPTNGQMAETGAGNELKLRNIVAVAEENGRATLIGTIVNSGAADILAGVDVAGGSATLSPSNPSLPPGVTQIGWVADSSGGSSGEAADDLVTVVLDAPDIEPGHTIPVTIRFDTAAPVSFEAQIVPNSGEFAGVTIPEPAAAPAHTPEDDSD